jgi:hypothetical protein
MPLDSITVGSSWRQGLRRVEAAMETVKQTKLGELLVPELFELEVVEHDGRHPDNPPLVINLLFAVVDERVELRGLIAPPRGVAGDPPLEVLDALNHLRDQRPLDGWKRVALISLAAGQARDALGASDSPDDEEGAETLFEAHDRANRTRVAQRRNRITAEHLASVASVYREAWKAGEHPTIAVESHFGVSHSTAARWVGQARREKHLGRPAEGSRGGEGTA